MSVLIIDDNQQRKQTLKSMLLQAGLLISNHQDDLTGQVNNPTIIIVLDETNKIDYHTYQWNSAFKNSVVIGIEHLIAHLPSKKSIYFRIKSNHEESAVELTKIALGVFYSYDIANTENIAMKNTFKIAKKAARSSASILISGETGSGKEIIAKYIHHHSSIQDGAFIPVNCAAIPETMIEAILFGYEKGAFTNAFNSYAGKFEQADHGTLFLDEIGEMSFDVQAKLLRVLQDGEIERIGGKKIKKINARVIAATNKDLSSLVTKGLFRSDLYYRLNVINIKCIPLRERKEDINVLADFFLQLYLQRFNFKHIDMDQSCIEFLKTYNWPGNIRELENVIQRAIILDENNIIEKDDIQFEFQNEKIIVKNVFSLREKENEIIVNALKEANGCRADAARKLKISPRTLRNKILKIKESGSVIL